MTSDAAGLTRTDKNLWNAILGEAMAYLKYNAYAHRALEEGYPEVAQTFKKSPEPRPFTVSTTSAFPET